MATNYNSIDEFKKAFRGGTRSNRFSVTATWPQNLGASNSFEMTRKTTFKITSTSMPDATVTTIPVNYRGRKIQFAGDRQYGIWRIDVYDDSESNNLWKIFQLWMEKIDGHQSHLYADPPDYDYSSYYGKFDLNQYGLNGGSNGDILNTSGIRKITLKNVWPAAVEPINLNMADTKIVQFTVSMHFDYFTFGDDNIATL